MGRRRKKEHLRVGWFSASSRSSWLVGALRDSAPSRWTLSLFYPSLVGTCWEHHYLTRLTPPPFFSTRDVTARGRFLLPLASAHFGSGCMLGHQLGCCSVSFCFFLYGDLSRFPPPQSPFCSFIQSDVTALKRVMVIAKVTACGSHEPRRCRLATRGEVRGRR